jgi:hypothetical protein
MTHRAKHLRRNWTPERKAKAAERSIAEGKRQLEDAERVAGYEEVPATPTRLQAFLGIAP